jgi:hypothetical protein
MPRGWSCSARSRWRDRRLGAARSHGEPSRRRWVCAGLALLLFALYERSVFEFHPGEGRVKWTRVRLLRRMSG